MVSWTLIWCFVLVLLFPVRFWCVVGRPWIWLWSIGVSVFVLGLSWGWGKVVDVYGF